ncbi:MAG TPA: MotA/TolQ/ExbB proton channel family protein [Bdellovibrionota bacterium]|nr:MotA/TolQ/ExbB proton channel family protein [Bdellovibrionota bacterium]
MAASQSQSIWNLIASGGFTMIPLVVCSLIAWAVIFERLWHYARIGQGLRSFHLEAINALLREDEGLVRRLCEKNSNLPTATLLLVALDRLRASDPRVRGRWHEALERQRQLLNLQLRQYLWLLGTIGSAAPFIGLFGTVIGILVAFQEMARTGSGGFTVVAAGISEALIATAAGIVVAVISVMAFNAFQTRWNGLVLLIKVQSEEISEVLASTLGKTTNGP